MRILSVVLALAAAGCAGYRAREADRPYTAGLAAVERIEVTTSGPAVRVSVWGSFPDACTGIDGVDRRRFGSRIRIEIRTRTTSGPGCEESPRPFVHSVVFQEGGLPPGVYSVTVNGVGGVQPISRRSVASADSTSARTLPCASRRTVTGGVSRRE